MNSDVLYAARRTVDRIYLAVREADAPVMRGYDDSISHLFRLDGAVAGPAMDAVHVVLGGLVTVASESDSGIGSWLAVSRLPRAAMLRALLQAGTILNGLAQVAARTEGKIL